MASAAHIRGMLLEEALLYLLRASGYRTINPADVRNDPTLHNGSSGLEVLGRGVRHQIDAIADYMVAPPFSYPQRLLVEAKCYKNKTTGVEVARNAIGVLKDVSEHWVTIQNNALPKQRYHYQYALFSSSGFTPETEQYAFAHDIYLIPLDQSRFIQPILDKIQEIEPPQIGNMLQQIPLNTLRFSIRRELQDQFVTDAPYLETLFNDEYTPRLFRDFIERCRRVGGAALAVLNKRFPVFLVPGPNINLNRIEDLLTVHITRDRYGWYLTRTYDQEPLFSFDVPQELLKQYEEEGLLSRERALDLKEENLSEIQAIVTTENRVRVLTFRLDTNWLQQLRDRR
jgi:hypothetical protein